MTQLYSDCREQSLFDEERITSIARRLMKFLIASYGPDHLDDYEDYVQESLIKLWESFQRDPSLMSRSDQQLYGLAIGFCRNAMHNAYSRKCRHIHTKGNRNGPKKLVKREFTISELYQRVRGIDQTDYAEYLLARATYSRFTHDSPEIREVDTRLELEALLRTGLAKLRGRQLNEVRALLTDMLLGYSQIEIAHNHGWTVNRVRIVMRLMRKTLIEVATGQVRQPNESIAKPKVTDIELQRIRSLRSQGLSQRKIAALIGRSPAFVQQHC